MEATRWVWIVLLVAMSFGAYTSESRSALIGHWNFDSDFTDSSGNGLDGFAQGTGTVTAGVTGTGRPTGVLQLGGTSNVGVNDNDLLDLPNTFTIAAWIKPTTTLASGVAAHIVRKLHTATVDEPGSEAYYLRLNGTSSGSQLDLLAQSPGNTLAGRVQFSPGPDLNEWTFVAGTYDGLSGVSNLYIGTDVPLITGTASVAPRATIGTLRIGRGPTGGGFTGFIDDVWIFNHVLSASELRELGATAVPEAATALLGLQCLAIFSWFGRRRRT